MVAQTWMTNLRGDKDAKAEVTGGRCAVCGRVLGTHVRFGRLTECGGLCLACLTALEEFLRDRE